MGPPRPAAPAVPWRGIAMLGCLMLLGYTAIGTTSAAAAPTDTLSVLTDAQGRIDFARIGAVGMVFAAVAGAVAWVIAPHFKARARTIRMEDKSAWAEDVFEAFAHDPERGARVVLDLIERNPENAKPIIAGMFSEEARRREDAYAIAARTEAQVHAMNAALSEAKILQAVPRIEAHVERLTEAQQAGTIATTALTAELRALREERMRERVADREEFGELRAKVNQIHNATYHGPERRHTNRRGQGEDT